MAEFEWRRKKSTHFGEVWVPIAFAAAENVPNLLGRLGVIEQRRVEFDPVAQVTGIEAAGA